MAHFYKILISGFVFYVFMFIIGCANQLPPGGGEEDKQPPKIIEQYPLTNALNYSGNSITLLFDKYVDRRSLQDAFFMSPPIEGDINYDWGGKEVEIDFQHPFYVVAPNKTFVITISSTLKDLHGNSLTQPITFAFSTGPKIDKASVSGNVINNDNKTISIFAYKISSIDTSYDPTKKLADYITETSTSGDYHLSNLSPGKYRIIAINDDDRNLRYTADREDYGVLTRDINISDSENVINENFNLKKLSNQNAQPLNQAINDYFKDSLNIIYSSIEDNSKAVLPDQSIFIYFNKYIPTRDSFVQSVALKDEKDISIKIVFNWLSDSLVEIFAANKFDFNKHYLLSFNLQTVKDSVYKYSLRFLTISQNSLGELKGLIRNKNMEDSSFTPVHIDLFSKGIKPQIKYSFDVTDTIFNFNNIVEAEYSLFAYIDVNKNNQYDFGNPFPFEFSEPFFQYPKDISIRGGWAVEDVILDFRR